MNGNRYVNILNFPLIKFLTSFKMSVLFIYYFYLLKKIIHVLFTKAKNFPKSFGLMKCSQQSE